MSNDSFTRLNTWHSEYMLLAVSLAAYPWPIAQVSCMVLFFFLVTSSIHTLTPHPILPNIFPTPPSGLTRSTDQHSSLHAPFSPPPKKKINKLKNKITKQRLKFVRRIHHHLNRRCSSDGSSTPSRVLVWLSSVQPFNRSMGTELESSAHARLLTRMKIPPPPPISFTGPHFTHTC